jgi:hypothetical protein
MPEIRPSYFDIAHQVDAWLCKELSGTEDRVLHFLLLHSLIGGKFAFSEQYGFVDSRYSQVNVIAELKNLNESTVRRAMASLEERGYIMRVREVLVTKRATSGNPYVVSIRPLIDILLGAVLTEEMPTTNRAPTPTTNRAPTPGSFLYKNEAVNEGAVPEELNIIDMRSPATRREESHGK